MPASCHFNILKWRFQKKNLKRGENKMEMSRKDRIEKISKGTGSSLKKKILATTLALSITFGGTAAFGAMNPEFLTQISDFINSKFNDKNTELSNTGITTKNAEVTDLNTFLSNLKAMIQSELTTKTDAEKTRVTNEIQGHSDDLQQQANTQATTDLEVKKNELQNTADTEITNGVNALNDKFNELFPTSTP
jgi:Skp family chaperone for outer membrane proteins